MTDTDLKLLAIIVPAVISITAVTLTQIYKLISDLSDKRRSQKIQLISIKHELLLNQEISKVIEHDTRTIGLKFVNTAWNSSDASVVYRKNIPYENILQIYSDIHKFNLLNERKALIKAEPDYPDKNHRLAIESADLISLNEQIGKNLEKVLKVFNPK